MSCGVGRRRGSDLALLWLSRRLEAVALIRTLACEPPYAMGAALEKTKNKKNQKLSELVCSDGKQISHYFGGGKQQERGTTKRHEETLGDEIISIVGWLHCVYHITTY